jgi:RHS repeat-associated protein
LNIQRQTYFSVSSEGVPIRNTADYSPFGVQLDGRTQQGDFYRYGFNGMEGDSEFKGQGNSYTTEFRQYDARLGRWLTVDPMMAMRVSFNPYNFGRNNPMLMIDPSGALDDEFDKNGKKISELGGNKIDFHHQDNGDTKVVDRETGASNIITGGERLLKNYTKRDKSTSWKKLFSEWSLGLGTKNSLLSDFDDTQIGFFGSMDEITSTYASKGREEVMTSGDSKGQVSFDYTEVNPFTASTDGWEQFLGRANLSYYKLGDKVLFMVNDSKSLTSLSYRILGDHERNIFSVAGNTYQTYIWTESMYEVKSKYIKSNYKHVNSLKDVYNSFIPKIPSFKPSFGF